jgi:hypothetical protein
LGEEIEEIQENKIMVSLYWVRTKMVIRTILMKVLWTVCSPILQRVLRSREIFLTCTRGDGGGAQWHGMFSVMAFCKEFGAHYVHTPIAKILPVDSQEKRDKWNALFDLTALSVPKPVGLETKKVRTLADLFVQVCLTKDGGAALFDIDHCHAYTDWNIQSVESMAPYLQSAFRSQHSVKTFESAEGSKLIVHLRRGHIEDGSGELRITRDDAVIDGIHSVMTLSGLSEGVVFCMQPEPQIESRLPDGIVFDSTSDEFEVIYAMSKAEYLILAKSSMSYVAGILCTGTVLYESFWHPKLKRWTSLDRIRAKTSLFEKQ